VRRMREFYFGEKRHVYEMRHVWKYDGVFVRENRRRKVVILK
jgi:hypothetical protein